MTDRRMTSASVHSFIEQQARAELDALAEHPTLKNFLAVASIAGRYDGGRWLHGIWDANVTAMAANDEDGDEAWVTVLEWLSGVAPLYAFGRPDAKPVSPGTRAVLEKTLSLTEEARTTAQRFTDALLERGNHRYGSFHVAYAFEDLLREFFKDRDPGVVIGSYVDSLFSSDDYPAPEPHHAVQLDAGTLQLVADHVLPWCCKHELIGAIEDLRKEVQSEVVPSGGTADTPNGDGGEPDPANSIVLSRLRLFQLAVANQFCPLIAGDPERFMREQYSDTTWRLRLGDIVSVLPLLPQHFFERYVSALIDSFDMIERRAYSEEKEDGLEDEILRLSNLCFSLPLGGADAVGLALPGDSELRGLMHLYDLSPEHLPFLSIDRWRGLQVVIWDAIHTNNCPRCDVELARTVAQRIGQYRRVRVMEGKGLPGTPDGWYYDLSLHFDDESLRWSSQDWPLRLGAIEHDLRAGMDTGNEGGVPVMSFPSLLLPEVAVGRRDRLRLALEIAGQAADDGFDELANAVLAFGIFLQVVLHPESLECDWRTLVSLVRRLKKLPGHDMVEKAMAIAAASVAEKAPGSPQVLLLAPWAKGDHASAPKEGPVNVAGLAAHVEEQIGSSVWKGLPGDVQNQLADAELGWDLHHRYVGTGRGDFGVVATSYVKAVELALGKALGPIMPLRHTVSFLKSEKRKVDPKPTLGNMIFLLEHYPRLPGVGVIRSSGRVSYAA